MQKSPKESALRLIEECHNTHALSLKLFWMGLTEIPEQISKLTWLQSLSCEKNYTLTNLPCLSSLSELQVLICFECQIRDLSPLTNLQNLHTLGCQYNPIESLSPLITLHKLQILACDSTLTSDLSPLAELSELMELSCSFNPISDLSYLSNLRKLETLKFSGNLVCDLLPLNGLLRLQSLDCSDNQVSDLSPLSGLPALQSLDCSDNQVSDLSPLSGLPALQSLACRGNKISDLSPLSGLPTLQSLDCRFNQISNLLPIQNFVLSEQLENLYLYGNPVCGIPAGLLGSNESETCQENLRSYWLDLANGAEKQQKLKVQFVGNGRVGKTTLAYALEHKRTPNEPFKSTHGIVIKEIPLTLDSELESVTLQLWDFGGQEIYHATHRLFLSDDCLYLLLWAEETEEHMDETRHPISYWLESIHDLAPNSPVILVKNQIDISDKQSGERPVDLGDDLPGADQIRHAVKVSAWTGRNMSILRGAIEAVIEELKQRVCLELPSSWMQVQRELEQLKAQKTIPFAHFKQLCIKTGVGHAEWFVGYLHKTGVLFYHEGAFQDQIILDQNWVIEAVYRVFDPKGSRRLVERMQGSFNGIDTQMFWPEVDETERKIYLGFMLNCGICYKPNRKHDAPFAEHEFIIPALLPKDRPAGIAWHKRDSDWQLEIEYPFLHRSIIERIILRLGETYHSTPWRYGIVCETGEHEQTLLMECDSTHQPHSNQGLLRFKLSGNQLKHLEYALRKLVRDISPHRRYKEYLSKGGKARTQLPEFEEDPQITTALEETNPMSRTIKLFISYAHEDEKPFREELDKRLRLISRQLPLEYWHDRKLLAGEQVHSKILQQLQEADIVVLLVSPDFVDSDYCFSHEMKIALQQFEAGQNVVIPVIIRSTPRWQSYQIGNHTALPTDAKPFSKWTDPDDFWAEVQEGIYQQVEHLLKSGEK